MNEPQKIIPGEVVRLKSGGPQMTVVSEDVATGRLVCVWFDNTQSGFVRGEDAYPLCALLHVGDSLRISAQLKQQEKLIREAYEVLHGVNELLEGRRSDISRHDVLPHIVKALASLGQHLQDNA